MLRNRLLTLLLILVSVTLGAVGSWFLGAKIQSPAEVAARTAPPAPSPILVPVERRLLTSDVVTRGTARFASPKTLTLIPSPLKGGSSVITSLPERNAPLKEGDVLLTTSGRPVFVLQGDIPVFHDMSPGVVGDNVRLLEAALLRMGFDPGPQDGKYDDKTSDAVARWYDHAGWEPFGPTPEQKARLRDLEQALAEGKDRHEKAKAAITAATLDLEAVSSKFKSASLAPPQDPAAQAPAASTPDAWGPIIQNVEQELALATKRKEAADTAVTASRSAADFATENLKTAKGQTPLPKAAKGAKPNGTPIKELEQVLATAITQKEQAEAAAVSARLEFETLQTLLANMKKKAAAGPGPAATANKGKNPPATKPNPPAALPSPASLESKMAIQKALDTKESAIREAEIAEARVRGFTADLEEIRKRTGVQVPADEIIFVPALPARVEQIKVALGDPAKGPILTVTNNQLVVDSSLPLEEGPLVKPDMAVAIDEPSLHIKAQGVVEEVAGTPGTNGVDGYHIYLRVRVTQTPVTLEGVSLRLTIPIETTGGEVLAVPVGALHLAADGTSRVQVSRQGQIESVVVEPGLTSKGYAEVEPTAGALEPGELVVVGFEHEQ